MLYAADHFIMREARLIDRHRFAYLFQDGPVAPIRTSLEAYRNVDGGYGNGLDPDLRGHPSQPRSVALALEILDELGELPRGTIDHITTYLTSITRPDSGLPRVLPSARHTESAPWWREYQPLETHLDPTGRVLAVLHKHHIPHAWRDRATAFAWKAVADVHQLDPEAAVSLCAFLDRVDDADRARTELHRLTPVLRAAVELDPRAPLGSHTPLDLAPRPDHIAAAVFTDDELTRDLDRLVGAQRSDGGWPAPRHTWCTAATVERRGIRTVAALRTLRAYGRLEDH